MAKFGIGQPVTRFEDPRLLRGQGRFINDVNLPAQAHAVLVRSPHAHQYRMRLRIHGARSRCPACWRCSPRRILRRTGSVRCA